MKLINNIVNHKWNCFEFAASHASKEFCSIIKFFSAYFWPKTLNVRLLPSSCLDRTRSWRISWASSAKALLNSPEPRFERDKNVINQCDITKSEFATFDQVCICSRKGPIHSHLPKNIDCLSQKAMVMRRPLQNHKYIIYYKSCMTAVYGLHHHNVLSCAHACLCPCVFACFNYFFCASEITIFWSTFFSFHLFIHYLRFAANYHAWLV